MDWVVDLIGSQSEGNQPRGERNDGPDENPEKTISVERREIVIVEIETESQIEIEIGRQTEIAESEIGEQQIEQIAFERLHRENLERRGSPQRRWRRRRQSR